MKKLSYLEHHKLTPLWSEEESSRIKMSLNKKHAAFLEKEEFSLEAGSSEYQIKMRLSLDKIDKSVVYPIECVYAKTRTGQETSIASLMLDYLDIYWTDYFAEDRSIFIPVDWSLHEFENVHFYLRGFVRYLKLENQADAFLQRHGHGEYFISPISSET
jgi:hypothetical protein